MNFKFQLHDTKLMELEVNLIWICIEMIDRLVPAVLEGGRSAYIVVIIGERNILLFHVIVLNLYR